jgi:hypothetical protein
MNTSTHQKENRDNSMNKNNSLPKQPIIDGISSCGPFNNSNMISNKQNNEKNPDKTLRNFSLMKINIVDQNTNEQKFELICKSKNLPTSSTTSVKAISTENSKTHVGTVSIKIFADQIGKRNYELSINTKNSESRVHQDQENNMCTIEGTNSNMIFQINSQKKKLTNIKKAIPYYPINNTIGDKKILFNLYEVMFNLFMNIPITKLNLNELEQQIIKPVIQKKYKTKEGDFEYSLEYFNKIRQLQIKKKLEDSLKFTFKKAIKKLKSEFKYNFTKGQKLSIKDIDRLFYEHYFRDLALKHNIPIESFYHFATWKKRVCDLVPKSVTKVYIKRLKLNTEFIDKLTDFFKNHFIKTFSIFNSNKIHKMIIKWEKTLETLGHKKGIELITTQLLSKRNKLPWSYYEATHAISQSLSYIQKC